MTVGEALREGVAALGASETPFLDASLLLAKTLGLGRAALLAAGPEFLPDPAEAAYRALLADRSRGLPVAYLVGEKEFWGRTFRIDRRALVPRPETEHLVAAALEAGDAWAARVAALPRVHEACCGSGCVIVSVAAERPLWPVSATDISEEALSLARENAELLLPRSRPGGPCDFAPSDLLASSRGPFDLILANPPYVPTAQIDLLGPELRTEPRLALDGGADGLDCYRRIVPEAASRLSPGGTLVLESDGSQAPWLRLLLEGSGYVEVSTVRDLAGFERITRGSLPWRN